MRAHTDAPGLAAVAMALALLATGCAHSSFQDGFDDEFVYGPLMQLASHPAGGLPSFSSLDTDCETIGSSTQAGGKGGVGGGSGGGPAPPPCPT
jgi:hypothetical protein